MSCEGCTNCMRCMKHTCKCCKAVSWLWSCLATIVTIVILYYLSGVHDVAEHLSFLKNSNISTPSTIANVSAIEENEALFARVSKEVQESVRRLKGVRKMFDGQIDSWDPKIPDHVPQAIDHQANN